MYHKPKSPETILPQGPSLNWTLQLEGDTPEKQLESLRDQYQAVGRGIEPPKSFMDFMSILLGQNDRAEVEKYLREFQAVMFKAEESVKAGVSDQASQEDYEKRLIEAVKSSAEDWFKNVELRP